MAELHTTYAPTTTAGAITRGTGVSQNVGSAVPTSVLNDPDNPTGSSSVAVPNQSSAIMVTGSTVKGRFNAFNVINNPA